MNIRASRAEDFTGVRSLVATAITEPFYRPDLTPAQRAENQHIIVMPSVVAKPLCSMTAGRSSVLLPKMTVWQAS